MHTTEMPAVETSPDSAAIEAIIGEHPTLAGNEFDTIRSVLAAEYDRNPMNQLVIRKALKILGNTVLW